MKQQLLHLNSMQYHVTPNNIHIYDSWIYNKHGFQSRLELIRREHPECLVFQHRSFWSMKMEWATHNFLFNLGLWQDRTGSVDLNWPQQRYVRTMYVIIGPIAWLFIQ